MRLIEQFRTDLKSSVEGELCSVSRAGTKTVFVWFLIAIATILSLTIATMFGVIAVESLNFVSVLMTSVMLPLAVYARTARQHGIWLFRQLNKRRQKSYIKVIDSSMLATILVRVMMVLLRELLSAIFRHPRIPDINLMPRLLPVPPLHRGAAI